MTDYEVEVARVEADTKAFMKLGITDLNLFEIREFCGTYMVDILEGRAYEVIYPLMYKKGEKFHCEYVSGLYGHLLDGTWHKSVNRSGQYD